MKRKRTVEDKQPSGSTGGAEERKRSFARKLNGNRMLRHRGLLDTRGMGLQGTRGTGVCLADGRSVGPSEDVNRNDSPMWITEARYT
nr:hypothetical protein BgiMline_019110 [Biomphalaria glabrata]